MPENITWILYTRGSVPPYRLEIALRGVQIFGTKYNGTRIDRVLQTNQGPNLTWGWDEEQLFAVGANIIRKCSTRTGQARHFGIINKVIKQANRASENVRQQDIRRLDTSGLIKLQRRLFQETGPAHGFLDVDIDAVDAVFEKLLYDKLRREVPEKYILSVFKALSVPAHQSYVAEEELAIDKSLRRGLPAADVDALYRRFWWTELGWEQVALINEEAYLEKILHLHRRQLGRKKLDQLAFGVRRTLKNRARIIKKHQLSSDIKYWLGVLDRYAYYHDRRKEMQCRSMYAFHLWLREAARRLKVSAKDLEWFYSAEIIRLLRGRTFDRKELSRRKKTLFVLADKSRLVILSGRRALAKRNQVLDSNSSAEKTVAGVGVTSGLVRARARVCNGIAEARRKVKTGDILVCGMTLPDYVPVMKRAAAIVTDEGGITCHAAIVARELHKPCVVGTKIATKVFRDGDRVEVDATKGIVKKL